MEAEFINLTEKNIDSEHLCCIIRSKTASRRGSLRCVLWNRQRGCRAFLTTLPCSTGDVSSP